MTSDTLSFRQWLVKQVLALRWTAPPCATLAQISQKLGVTVDVLEEAKALRELKVKRLGRTPRPGGKRALLRSDYAIVRAILPPEILKAWKEYHTALRIASGALLRSLVHHFLLAGAPRPQVLTRSWRYQGQVYRIKERGNSEAVARVTLGALTALDHYAELWGVKPMCVVRGLMTDLLENRVTKLRIVGYGELWGDPDRYLHPEKFKA
jgi:hypothetical protein